MRSSPSLSPALSLALLSLHLGACGDENVVPEEMTRLVEKEIEKSYGPLDGASVIAVPTQDRSEHWTMQLQVPPFDSDFGITCHDFWNDDGCSVSAPYSSDEPRAWDYSVYVGVLDALEWIEDARKEAERLCQKSTYAHILGEETCKVQEIRKEQKNQWSIWTVAYNDPKKTRLSFKETKKGWKESCELEWSDKEIYLTKIGKDPCELLLIHVRREVEEIMRTPD